LNENSPDLALCAREPIHIPGAIQPHGLLLVADPDDLRVSHVAGDAERWLGRSEWLGTPLDQLLGEDVATAARRAAAGERCAIDCLTLPSGATASVLLHRSGRHLAIEVESGSSAGASLAMLTELETISLAFEQCTGRQELFDAAAAEVQRVTGFSRVMVYRFLDDGAGVVLAESRSGEQHSFLNHHFPATDIPAQARALYVRNRIRVIPDVDYRPAPLQPAWSGPEPLDMSDCALRSVSPVHVQYLKNMGVAASASLSIVLNGALWGMIACHHHAPRTLPPAVRAHCRLLAGTLARQIAAREENEAVRERVRLRSYEDDVVALLSREGALDHAISNHLGHFMRMLGSDGVAVLRGSELVQGGRCPQPETVRRLAHWAIERSSATAFATARLGEHLTLEEPDAALAAGLLAVTLSTSEPWVVLWFRADRGQVVSWAGNPHKSLELSAAGALSPRSSFAAWNEIVRGRAVAWTLPEIEAATRLREAVMTLWQHRRIRDLNKDLLTTLEDKEQLLRQKEYLIGEVNHRVQNSLQLVSSFLALQARSSGDAGFRAAVDEARQRIRAVSLVHRRLYKSEQVEAIDVARYLEELLGELIGFIGPEWAGLLQSDLQPVMLPNDRAVALGLIVTELVINANKYAYPEGRGPIRIRLTQDRQMLHLVVADEGRGRRTARKGFGSRMLDGLVGSLHGTLEYEDAKPGTRAVLAMPLAARTAESP